MKLVCCLCIIFWLHAASSYLPRTRPSSPRPLKPYFPPDLQIQGHKLQPDLRIPNEKFCKEMQLSPSRQYMILPWWYVHCERLLENEEQDNRAKANLPIYRKILKYVQDYKKKQKLEKGRKY